MTTMAALKASAQDFTLPAWVTVHNAELAAGALVVILLACAVLRLSKGSKAPPPAPVPKKSGAGGLLLVVVAAVGGLLAWGHYKPAEAGAKAAPAPSPSPVPRPTVTQTIAPHVTLPAHFPLTGTQILIGLFVIAVFGYLMVRVVARNAS